MIITIAQYREFIDTDESDAIIEMKINALEAFVCSHTHNDFIDRETGLKSYPADVIMGVINLAKWDYDNRDIIGVSSETISRHSVSYGNNTGDSSTGGFPAMLIGFLHPYMKARF